MRKLSPYKKLAVLGFLNSLVACSDGAQFTENGIGSSSDGAAVKKAGEPDTSVEEVDASNPDSSSPGSDQAGSPTVEETTIGGTSPADGSPSNRSAMEDIGEVIIKTCEQGTKKTLTQRISFPENRLCNWGNDGNLTQKDAHLQAVEVQTSAINLPDKAQLCSLEISSEATTLHYDDFIVLTLNGYVLLSSNQQILEGLSGSTDTTYKWDFSRIRGIPVDFNSPAYCMGELSSVCEVPVTDTPGKFQFSISPESLIHLADQIVNNRSMNFSLIATGDDNEQDCFHTEMNLEFHLQYVEM